MQTQTPEETKSKSFTGPDVYEIDGVKFRRPTSGTIGLMVDLKCDMLPEFREPDVDPVTGAPVMEKNEDGIDVQKLRPQKNPAYNLGLFLWIHSGNRDEVRRTIQRGTQEDIDKAAFDMMDRFPPSRLGELFQLAPKLVEEVIVANDFQVAKEKGEKGAVEHPNS